MNGFLLQRFLARPREKTLARKEVSMKDRLIEAADFQIRALATPAEIEMFFQLNAVVFRPDEDHDLVTKLRQRFLTLDPDFQRHQLRGAFVGDSYVGGYALLERTMCLGPAWIR